MNVGLLCPNCERPGQTVVPATSPWNCPHCGHLLPLSVPNATTTPTGLTLHSCAVCGNHELYKMKGFPHWLGLTILSLGIAVFLVCNALRYPWLAWGGLLGSWLLDLLLYKLVNDVVVCYRCGSKHAGVGRSGNEPFELSVHERYRQERQLG